MRQLKPLASWMSISPRGPWLCLSQRILSANSAQQFLLDARIPCLVVSAADDPWIDAPYRSVVGERSELTPV